MNCIKSILAFLLMTQTAITAAAADREIRSCDRLPMSAYIWQGNLRDSDFVNHIDFGNFDMVYLMDKSMWQSRDDFDRTIDSILADRDAIAPLTKRDLFALSVDSAHAAGTKALWSVGNDLLYTSLDDVRLDKMCRVLAKTVDIMDFDGLDIDWEIDVWRHFDRHALLMASLRKSLDSLSNITGKKYLLSSALSAEANYPDEHRKTFADAVDHINLMAYDLGGCLWRDYATHNTPMQIISDNIDKYWYGFPRNKLHLGLASYGFMYNGILPGEKVPEGKTIGDYGRFVDYYAMLPYLYGNSAWRVQYDPVDKMNYFIDDKSHSFITMETPESVVHKFDFTVSAGLGGTFWWEYAKDIVPDNDGSPRWRHILVPTHRQISRQKNK